MKVMVQMVMVMNFDKCIGCYICLVICKQVWINCLGIEYVWFNNVEICLGVGYLCIYEDQEWWCGGWVCDKKGWLWLCDGGWIYKLLCIFVNFKLFIIGDYYELWIYDYENLILVLVGDIFLIVVL